MADKQQSKPHISQLSDSQIAKIGNKGVRIAIKETRAAGLKPAVREPIPNKRVTAAE